MASTEDPRLSTLLRLDLGPIDWEDVTQLVAGSYTLVAPKTLAKLVRG